MRTALTIAGSDSGGGAGIQADLKSFAAVGVHGTSVITCVTAQNTRAVTSIFPLPAEEIRAQLRAVLEDFDISGAKTGMLYSADIVNTVAGEIGQTDFPLVVDPVMVATVGARLERDDFRDALVARLLTRADLVTPNRGEAERLSGSTVRTLEDMEAAARTIRGLGAHAVLVKGGHVAGELVDVLYDGTTMRHFRSFRHAKELHGAGCTLAASTAAYLAQGLPLVKAVESARRRVAAGFLLSYRAGRGVEIINSHVQPDRYEVWHALSAAAPTLSKALLPRLRSRKGATMVYALPAASIPGDVCIWRDSAGTAAFNATAEEARVVLAALHINPRARAAATLRYPSKFPMRLESSRLTVLALEGTSRARGGRGAGSIERAIAEAGPAPDVLVAAKGNGRDTTVTILGEDPDQVLRKARRLAGRGAR